MASTTLLNFLASPEVLLNPVNWKTTQEGISTVFHDAGFDCTPHTVSFDGNSGSLMLFTGKDGRSAVVQSYPEGLITINLQDNSKRMQESQLTNTQLDIIKDSVATLLGCKVRERPPRIYRGDSFNHYYPTTDNRLIEYDFDDFVFEHDSQYQNIKIAHSLQYGNMLILDDDPNLAESDIAYTAAITGNGRQDYRGKDILILGGGDGGILHTLRQQDPAMITMIEIDQCVIEAATKYLRGICHDSMDQLKGSNYNVIISDCVLALKQYVKEGKQFDVVINDLTAIPITTEAQGNQWDFLRLILDLSIKVLKPPGRYFTQGNGANSTEALAMYEEQLSNLSCEVDFSKETVCVPSYVEMWVFYEIWKKSGTL